MKAGTETRNKLQHKGSKNSQSTNEKEGDHTMPAISVALGPISQPVLGKSAAPRKLKQTTSSSVLLNRLDGPHNFYGVTMSREQQVKFMLRE